MSLGLYVHVPFCVRKCHYCNFVIAPSGDLPLRAAYFDALEAEIRHARARYGSLTFDTVYLGGGTPSALSAEETKRLFELLAENFLWKSDAEITCEVNPGEVDASKLELYRRLGVNRISLGVQSTQDHLLESINRAHNTEDARETARIARGLGFDNLSMDLMIRLPNQKVEDVIKSVSDMVEWGTHQIVIYDLCVHDKTHFGSLKKSGLLKLPSEAEHEQMFGAVEKLLLNAGFVHYEVASFARPGFESRHNLIYWHSQPYLGLGPGAFSYMEGRRYVYASSVKEYVQKAVRRDWSPHEEDVLSPEERQSETLLTGLRLSTGVDLAGFDLLRPALDAEIASLAREGLVEYDGTRIRLTRKGRYLAESVFARISEIRLRAA